MTMRLTAEGRRLPIEEWAEEYGIPVALIRSRLRRGWSDERAVTEPMVVRRGEKLPADAMKDVKPAPRPIVGPPIESTIVVPAPLRAQPKLKLTAKPIREPKFMFAGRPSRLVTHDGTTRTIIEWADLLGISKQAMHVRLATNPATAFLTRAERVKGERITFDGRSLTIREWADELGISYFGLNRRLKNGVPPEIAFTRPKCHREPAQRELLTFKGHTRSVESWATHLDLDANTIRRRLKAGWPLEEALNPVLRRGQRPPTGGVGRP